MELEKQRGRDRKRGLVVAVDRLDLQLVDELDPGHGDRVLRDANRTLHSRADRREVHTAAAAAEGFGWMRSVASQIRPSVPSEPIISRVRSYPAEDLRALECVRKTSPRALTTVTASTFSRIAP